MADEIPAALKQADLSLFKCATKALQLQTIKPIVAYWCEYWVVNQVLAKQLHQENEDILNYTMKLMDKLEQTKAENADENAITIDAAGQTYIEDFAQETLDRAERVIRANKVTTQTAQTFDAAATFFHLANIWGAPSTDTQQKIRYAKWNAARIARAIKEGKDPNESNPKPAPLSKSDAEVPPADTPPLASPLSVAPQPAKVENVQDDEFWQDAAAVSSPEMLAAPHAQDAAEDDELRLPGVPTGICGQEQGPTQLEYLEDPALPSPISPPSHDPVTHQPPSAPESRWDCSPIPPLQSTYSSPPPSAQGAWQAPTTVPSAPLPSAPPSSAPSPTFSSAAGSHQPFTPPFANTTLPPPCVAREVPASSRPGPTLMPGDFVADEAALVGAQKHAKWAISALNFEDVPTAVRELRKALEMLGAT